MSPSPYKWNHEPPQIAAICVQARQGGCLSGPCAMSTSNEGNGYKESVLIAYGWSRQKPATDLPDEIVALCPADLDPLELPRATGYIHRKRVPTELLSEPPPHFATAVTFFRITATIEQTRQLSHYDEWPKSCRHRCVFCRQR